MIILPKRIGHKTRFVLDVIVGLIMRLCPPLRRALLPDEGYVYYRNARLRRGEYK